MRSKFTCQPTWMLGAGLAFFLVLQPCQGEPAPTQDQLIGLACEDFGICLVVNDFAAHWQKIQDTGWYKAFRKSPLAAALGGDPEMQRLAQLDQELKKHFQLGWDQFRDEILGGTLVLAYRPPAPDQSTPEEGLILLWTRNSGLLKQLIERLNQLQKDSKELKELVPQVFRNRTYYRRVDRNKPHFYLLEGSLLAFSAQEKVIRELIERLEKKPSGSASLREHLKRAGMEDALAALLVKPRAFDADIQARARKVPDPQAQALKTFFHYWKGLDNIVVALKLGEDPELRVSVQGRPANLPVPVHGLLAGDSLSSELWTFFPGNALVRVAGRIDAAALVQVLGEFTPPATRKVLAQTLQRHIGAALGLDLARDVLPNLGPDWGFCLIPGTNAEAFPQMVAALRVKAGSPEAPVDRALFRAAQFFAGLAVFDHNRKHADPIHLKMIYQDKVEIHYLVKEKAFPAGFQPAMALKSGYFLLASSPEAIRQFHKGNSAVSAPGEIPLVHLSFRNFSEWLKNRKEKVVRFLAEQNNLSPAATNEGLNNLLAGLELFDHALLSQQNGRDQVTWVLRLRGSSGPR